MSKPKKIKPSELRGWTRESLYRNLCLDREKLDATEAKLKDAHRTIEEIRKNYMHQVARSDEAFERLQHVQQCLDLALDRIKVLEQALAKEQPS